MKKREAALVVRQWTPSIRRALDGAFVSLGVVALPSGGFGLELRVSDERVTEAALPVPPPVRAQLSIVRSGRFVPA